MSIFNRFTRGHVTVDVGSVILEYRNGKQSRILPPGRHTRRRGAVYQTVDLRENLVPVALQEVLTSDGIPIRVSMTMRVTITDAVRFVERADFPVGVAYLAAQIALRELMAGVAADDLIRRGDAVDAAPIVAAARAAVADLGVAVHDVVIKDVVVPAEIRSAAMEIITAKARGQVKLEQARAETAALRALANAGRVLDASPALARLRLVQEVPYGARVVLSVGDAEMPASEPGSDT